MLLTEADVEVEQVCQKMQLEVAGSCWLEVAGCGDQNLQVGAAAKGYFQRLQMKAGFDAAAVCHKLQVWKQPLQVTVRSCRWKQRFGSQLSARTCSFLAEAVDGGRGLAL